MQETQRHRLICASAPMARLSGRACLARLLRLYGGRECDPTWIYRALNRPRSFHTGPEVPGVFGQYPQARLAFAAAGSGSASAFLSTSLSKLEAENFVMGATSGKGGIVKILNHPTCQRPFSNLFRFLRGSMRCFSKQDRSSQSLGATRCLCTATRCHLPCCWRCPNRRV